MGTFRRGDTRYARRSRRWGWGWDVPRLETRRVNLIGQIPASAVWQKVILAGPGLRRSGAFFTPHCAPAGGLANMSGRWRAENPMSDETCDACDQPWEVLFEWDYTDTERYCRAHILEPLEAQPRKTLLDFMPDCQR